jgi:gliding motility-associated-like protein
MSRPAIILILICSFAFSQCKKNDAPRITHCDNLVNDPKVNDGSFVAVPNAFTPNGDGLNDQYKPIANKISKLTLTIFDSKNNIAFSTQNMNEGWNPGPILQSGTKFYYRVEAEAQSGRRIGVCGELLYLSCIPKNFNIATLNFQDEADAFGNFTTPTAEPNTTCN